jgi:S1-C subfamily serine protease
VVFIANTAIRRGPWSLNLFEVPQGSGSGFIWNTQGHIVTNFHVIYGADAITVTLSDRTEHRARIVGLDPATISLSFKSRRRLTRWFPSRSAAPGIFAKRSWPSVILSGWIIR